MKISKTLWLFVLTLLIAPVFEFAAMAQNENQTSANDRVQNKSDAGVLQNPVTQKLDKTDPNKDETSKPDPGTVVKKPNESGLRSAEQNPAITTAGNWIVIILIVLLLLVAATFAVRAALNPQENYIQKLGPSFFFWLGMLYLGLLLTGAALKTSGVFDFFFPKLIADVLPIGVPWFGALGAVTISLQGVFDFNKEWKSEYNYWHIGRPIFGAVLGMVSFFMFVVIVNASGGKLSFNAAEGNNLFVYYVLAFIVGYREATFRELLQRAADLILKPGETKKPAPTATVNFLSSGAAVKVLDFGNVAQGSNEKKPLEIHNVGNAVLAKPKVEMASGEPDFAIAPLVAADIGDLAPGQRRKFEITFTPTGTDSYKGQVSVTSASLAAAETFDLSGTGT